MEYEDYLFVPKERVGALIGEGGKVKREIERKGKIILKINGETGEVDVERDDDTDAFMAMKAESVVKAIGRGFNPVQAMKLFEEGIYLEVLNIKDYVGNSKKALERQKARLIGTKGKARRMLEEVTGTQISIYGKTVSAIGTLEDVELAAKAIDMLLRGIPHGDVYKMVQIESRKMF